MGPKPKPAITHGSLNRLQVLQTSRQGFQSRQRLTAFQQAPHCRVITAGMLHSQHRPAPGGQCSSKPFHLRG